MKQALCALLVSVLLSACQWLPSAAETTTLDDTPSAAATPAASLLSQELLAAPDSQLASVPLDTLAALLDGLRRMEADVTALTTAAAEEQGEDPDGVPFDFPWIRFGAALLLFALAWFGIRLVAYIMEAMAERMVDRRMMVKRLVPVVRIGAWAATFYVVLRWVVGVDTRGLIAAGAAAGVAVGFAAQDILKNIFGGIIVILDQPFQVGDKIRVGGTYGEVTSIGLRSTTIVTGDDNLVTVPNAQVVDEQVANANSGELNCQVVTELFLPGWVDEGKAKTLAREAAVSSEYVYLKKPVVVLIRDVFKETFLIQVVIKAYVLDPRLELLFMSDVTERARVAFRGAGLLPEDHRFMDPADDPVVQPAAPEGEF